MFIISLVVLSERSEIVMSFRVFIISPTESVLTTRGKRHPKLADELAKKGLEVIYLTSNFSHAEKINFTKEQIDSIQKELNYKCIFLHVGKYLKNISFKRVLWNQFFSIKVYLKLRSIVKSGDIVIIPSRPSELIFVAGFLKRRANCKVLMDIRDIWPDSLISSNSLLNKLFTWYCNILQYPSIKLFDTFLHVSPCFEKWLHRYAPLAESYFMPLGFDDTRWIVSKGVEESSFQGTVKLIYCGTLTVNFDPMPVIKAIKDRRKFHITLVGNHENDKNYEEIKSYTDKYLKDRVRILGVVKPQEICSLFAQHHITIVPVTTNLLPNKIFDALGGSLPILSLGNNDSSDFVKKYKVGWCAQFSKESVGKVLDSVDEREYLEKLNNITRVREDFSYKNLFLKYTECVQNISSNRSNLD